MRLLALDTESSGLDVAAARILELGVVVWCTETSRPLITVGEFLYDGTYPQIEPKVTELTGITNEILKEFGQEPRASLEWLENFAKAAGVSYLVGHNIINYDLPLLWAECGRNQVEVPFLKSLPVLDTKVHLPNVNEFESLKLRYLSADHGFVLPFSHRAVFDSLACLKILTQYEIEAVIANSQKRRITIRALVDYDNRQAARDKRFYWEPSVKQWRKEIYEDALDAERAQCPFQIGVIDGKN